MPLGAKVDKVLHFKACGQILARDQPCSFRQEYGRTILRYCYRIKLHKEHWFKVRRKEIPVENPGELAKLFDNRDWQECDDCMLEIAQYGAVFIYPEDEIGIEHMLKNEGYCLNQQLPFDTDERQECQKFLTGMSCCH